MTSVLSVIEQQTRWAKRKALGPKDAYMTSPSGNLRRSFILRRLPFCVPMGNSI
jgi:hypothetical protein